MKATIDTNAVINLCDDDANTNVVIGYFKTHTGDRIYVLAKTHDELKNMSAHQAANLAKLEAASDFDTQRYFTVGESVVGGADTIRSDNATHDGIQKEVIDVTGAYTQYKADQTRNGNPVKI